MRSVHLFPTEPEETHLPHPPRGSCLLCGISHEKLAYGDFWYPTSALGEMEHDSERMWCVPDHDMISAIEVMSS